MSQNSFIVIHIPFTLGYRASGGGIRPQQVIKAFKEEGKQVIVISGGHKDRAKAFKELWKKVSGEQVTIEFIYSEASANPTILTDKKNWYRFKDFFYLMKLKKKGIRTFLFYRDVHWNVPGVYAHYTPLKRFILDVLHRLDLLIYMALVDVLLLPTLRMAPLIPYSNFFKISEMPPGHDVYTVLSDRDMSFFPKGIFVGGVTKPIYDISSLLIDDFPFKKITVCCRRDEWELMNYRLNPCKRINVVHLSGEELKEELKINHVSLMIRKFHEYHIINQPIKIYESIGFELPIVISPNSLGADIVKALDIGWLWADGLTITYDDYKVKLDNIRKIKPFHTWRSRVRDLISLTKNTH